jgi:hypothetical protein
MSATISVKQNVTLIVAAATATIETDTVTSGILAMKSTRRNLIGFGMRRTDARNVLKKRGRKSADVNADARSENGRNTGRLSMNRSSKRMSGDRKKRRSFLK